MFAPRRTERERMKRIAVMSSTVASAGYDDASQTMEIEFTGGAVYRYEGVPREVFDGLLAAESVGRFFNEHVRDVYGFTRL
jgi:hypothetical protein